MKQPKNKMQRVSLILEAICLLLLIITLLNDWFNWFKPQLALSLAVIIFILVLSDLIITRINKQAAKKY